MVKASGVKAPGGPRAKPVRPPVVSRLAGCSSSPQPAPEPAKLGETRRGTQLWSVIMTKDVR
jgi:hypothetical protein